LDCAQPAEGKGIAGDARCFGRLCCDAGQPTRRQVMLIEREQIAEHAAALGLPSIAPGADHELRIICPLHFVLAYLGGLWRYSLP